MTSHILLFLLLRCSGSFNAALFCFRPHNGRADKARPRHAIRHFRRHLSGRHLVPPFFRLRELSFVPDTTSNQTNDKQGKARPRPPLGNLFQSVLLLRQLSLGAKAKTRARTRTGSSASLHTHTQTYADTVASGVRLEKYHPRDRKKEKEAQSECKANSKSQSIRFVHHSTWESVSVCVCANKKCRFVA